MEVAAHMEVKTSVSNKKKRLHSGDATVLLQSSRDDSHADQCPVSAANSPENSVSWTKMCEDLDKIPANSLSLMNQSMKICPTSSDLKGGEISLSNHDGFSLSFSSNKRTQELMESPEAKRKKSTFSTSSTVVAKMPSAEEIEEFFSAAEKREQKRFAEKYNYDVVKDVPLEGRYHWVCLKP